MKNFLKIITACVVILLLTTTFTDVSAQNQNSGVPNQTSGGGVSIPNPLQGQGTDTLMGLLNSIINKIVIPIGGVVIAFMIIYTGFKFVTAQGKPAELQQARMMFLYVVIGAAILLGAWGISQMICGTINQISGGGLCG